MDSMKAVSLLVSFLLQQPAPAIGLEASIQHRILCRCSQLYHASKVVNAPKEEVFVQRREFVSRILHVVSLSLLTFPLEARQVQADGRQPSDDDFTTLSLSNPDEISQFIIQNCNKGYLQSVKSSGYNFLYRGLSVEEEEIMSHQRSLENKAIMILNEPYDLLDPQTYHSKEAASYFQSLEDKMSAWGSSIKPSNAHIATTCPSEASKWGTAVSIWPLGESGVEFLWLKGGGVFWPPPDKTGVAQKFERNTNDVGIERALEGDGWEIMFRAPAGFLAVSVEMDDELRKCLRYYMG